MLRLSETVGIISKSAYKEVEQSRAISIYSKNQNRMCEQTTQSQPTVPSTPIPHLEQSNAQYLTWLNLETYTFLGCLNKDQIINYLNEDLAARFPLRDDEVNWLPLLETEIESLAEQLFLKGQQLDGYFYQYHQTSIGHQEAIAAHDMMHELLCVQPSEQGHTEADLQQLKHHLIDACTKDPINYYLKFELGWYYHYLEDNPALALESYMDAADQCLMEDCPFAILALRHLASLQASMGNIDDAIKTTKHAIDFTEDNAEYYQYELALLHISHQNSEATTELLEPLLDSSSYYFLKVESEPDFKNNALINNLVQTKKSTRIDEIQQSALSQWHSKIEPLDLPREIDTDLPFKSTFESYSPLIEQQAYPVLLKHHAISEKIIGTTSAALIQTLQEQDEIKNQSIVEKRKKWQAIHNVGVIALYLAALLLIASVIIYAGRDFIDNALNLQLSDTTQAINWRSTLWVVISTALTSTFCGIFLLQFEPFSIKTILKGKRKINNAITIMSQENT